jgi:tetratricopeptide (TPR) repeat protein
MERALSMLLESGAGREAAIVQNNLGIARFPREGVIRSIATFEEGIEFCLQRGLVEAEHVLENSRMSVLVEAGRPDEALADADKLMAWFESAGHATDLAEARAVQLIVGEARAERPNIEDVEGLVDAARHASHVDNTAFALSAAVIALAAEAPIRAQAFLAELEQSGSLRETPYYSRQLAALVRAAIAIGDAARASQLIQSVRFRYPLDEHAACAARAAATEHEGDFPAATALYVEAADRWKAFGNVPEHAHALLGQGRALQALDDPAAEEPLREAREIFASLRYTRALAETEALLEQAAAARPS